MKKTLSSGTLRYHCQYDNKLYPGGSCNMTAVSTALSFYGISITPDELLVYCDTHGWDRHELEVIDRMLELHGVSDKSSYRTTLAEVKAHILAGNPTIVHGMFTPSGHIVGVYGVDEEKGKWYCMDPAGKWDPTYHYGGPNWKPGNGVWYGADWFRAKAAPDGYVWAHLLSKKK